MMSNEVCHIHVCMTLIFSNINEVYNRQFVIVHVIVIILEFFFFQLSENSNNTSSWHHYRIHIFQRGRFIFHHLKELNTLGGFYTIFHKGDNFCDFLLAFLHKSPLKMVLLLKKRIRFQRDSTLEGKRGLLLKKRIRFQRTLPLKGKGVYSKRKEFAPREQILSFKSRSFFRWQPIFQQYFRHIWCLDVAVS